MTSKNRVSFSIRTMLLATATTVTNVGGLSLLCGWAIPVQAASDEPTPATLACAPVSAAQHGIIEAAANGVDALRSHLWARRRIRGYDFEGTVQWIDGYRVRSANCAFVTDKVMLSEPAALPLESNPAVSLR